jgi:DNA-binding NtrC family response regulator
MEALLRRAMRELPNGRPFVVVDCGQRDVIEERLFGAAAPPGETSSLERIGEGSAVHAALGGTLVLRLLPEMPARLQLRLARILRDGEVVVGTAAGGWRVEQVAFRPIATSESADGDGLVPELCRRMSQHVLVVPPLRARREDIPGLVRLLLVDVCAAAGTAPKTASSQAVDLLIALPWRGNLGELETLLRRLVRTVPGRHVRLADVLAHVRLDGQLGAAPYHGTLREARAQFEREYVAAVLDQHRGRMSDAARALGLQRTNLYRKVRQLAVRRGSLARHVS